MAQKTNPVTVSVSEAPSEHYLSVTVQQELERIPLTTDGGSYPALRAAFEVIGTHEHRNGGGDIDHTNVYAFEFPEGGTYKITVDAKL